MSRRYFRNPYVDVGRNDIDASSLKDRIMMIYDQILKNLEATVKNGEKGVYVGTAGIAYALYYLVKSGMFISEHHKLLGDAKVYIRVALDAHNTRSRKAIGLMSGNSGVLLVASLVYAEMGHQSMSMKYVEEYKSFADSCKSLEENNELSDELFVGRAGYLLGVMTLQRDLKIDILTEREIFNICDAIIESGKKQRSNFDLDGDLPLMYFYHSKPYLGAAHGFAGVLLALLSFQEYFRVNPDQVRLVKKSVDFLLNQCIKDGNVATNLSGALSDDGKYLVHWCHGAAGVIYTFAKAYLVFGKEEKYLDACRVLADTVWEKGLLRKGPGICHGMAGNGYVFLLMYRLTKEDKYIYKAQRFANFMFTDEFKDGSRKPDRPYSLFEGWAGALCFLVDLLQPEKAEFPFMNIFPE